MKISKIVAPMVGAISYVSCFSGSTVWAQAGGVDTAVKGAGDNVLAILLNVTPIIFLVMIIGGVFMILSRKFGWGWIFSVFAAAIVVVNAENILNLAGMTVT